ncbi:hypothetical protein D3C80_701050 [compost metagenome]
MKDANDKQTIDGFADLLRDLDEHPPEDIPVRPGIALSDLAELVALCAEKAGIDMPKPVPGSAHKAKKAKPGPKPKHGETMSGAERAKAFRDRKRAEREADRARLAAEKPTSKIIDLSTDLRGALIERRGDDAS